MDTKNPLDYIYHKRATASAETIVTATTGKHVLDDTSNCPICKNPMRILTVGERSKGIRSYVCIADRVSLPLKE